MGAPQIIWIGIHAMALGVSLANDEKVGGKKKMFSEILPCCRHTDRHIMVGRILWTVLVRCDIATGKEYYVHKQRRL